MLYGFSIISNMRTYSIEMRERDYPIFEGKYNAYLAVYGQLSGNYLGNIEIPIQMDCDYNDMPELLMRGESFLMDNRNVPVSIW